MSFHSLRPAVDLIRMPGRLALGLVVFSSLHVASAHGTEAVSSPPIPWELALINGLQVEAESLGIRDRIRVVTLGASGCMPRSAKLFTVNPESAARSQVDISVQGRSIQFEVEGATRRNAVLKIECQEREADDGGPPRTFFLALDPRKAR